MISSSLKTALLVQILSAIAGVATQSECSGYFSYARVLLTNETIGIINIPSPPSGVDWYLSVHMYINAQLRREHKGRIELTRATQQSIPIAQQGGLLQYRVYFPLQQPLPIVYSIMLNNRRLCFTPPATGAEVTLFELLHTFYQPVIMHIPGGEGNIVQPILPEEHNPPRPSQPTSTLPPLSRPAPTWPAPTWPAPTWPAPTWPAQTWPSPTPPAPTRAAPTWPAQTWPSPTPPTPTRAALTWPAQTWPSPTPPTPTRAALTWPAPTWTAPSWPASSWPSATRPAPTWPAHTWPSPTPLVPTRPAPTRPPPPQPTPTPIEPLPEATTGTVFPDLIPGYSQDCGWSRNNNHVDQLVVSGKSTSIDQWPWLVAIFVSTSINAFTFQCSGTLVSNNHIVTAAHCFRSNNNYLPAGVFHVSLGRNSLRNWRERGSKNRNIARYKLHPDYDQTKTNADADLAIIVLSERVEYSAKIKPICLWSGNPELISVRGMTGFVVGWGEDGNGNKYVQRPRMARELVVNQEDCVRDYPAFASSTSTRTFCAGLRNGTGPCYSDCGSGLVVHNSITNRYYLRGVRSVTLRDNATRSCEENHYSIYVDIAKHLQWVQQQIATEQLRLRSRNKASRINS